MEPGKRRSRGGRGPGQCPTGRQRRGRAAQHCRPGPSSRSAVPRSERMAGVKASGDSLSRGVPGQGRFKSPFICSGLLPSKAGSEPWAPELGGETRRLGTLRAEPGVQGGLCGQRPWGPETASPLEARKEESKHPALGEWLQREKRKINQTREPPRPLPARPRRAVSRVLRLPRAPAPPSQARWSRRLGLAGRGRAAERVPGTLLGHPAAHPAWPGPSGGIEPCFALFVGQAQLCYWR